MVKVVVKKNCWEFKKCGRQPGGGHVDDRGECPAVKAFKAHGLNEGINGGRSCWAVAGTFCHGQTQGTFVSKFVDCSRCDFFIQVMKEEGERLIPVQEILRKLNAKQ